MPIARGRGCPGGRPAAGQPPRPRPSGPMHDDVGRPHLLARRGTGGGRSEPTSPGAVAARAGSAARCGPRAGRSRRTGAGRRPSASAKAAPAASPPVPVKLGQSDRSKYGTSERAPRRPRPYSSTRRRRAPSGRARSSAPRYVDPPPEVGGPEVLEPEEPVGARPAGRPGRPGTARTGARVPARAGRGPAAVGEEAA